MSIDLEATSDVTGSKEPVFGSDNRINVSARSDARSYYNSRDERLAFSLSWDDASTATGDYVLYWQNTDTTGKVLVIEGIDIGSQYGSDWQLQEVTGTGGGGSAATPVCLNRESPKLAPANCFTAVSSTVTIGAIGQIINHPTVPARNGRLIDLKDKIRLGQNGAIALQCILTDTSPGLTQGTIFGYYE